MIATVALVELAGYVVLLLWGMHMVQSGVVRAFGSDLRRVIGRTLRNRVAAVGAGMAVTALLQSSTATAMMTTSLAADGMVALVPALAVMLGANIGTALIVKALSFDVSWVAPLLLIAGYVAFRRGRRGRLHDLGRAGIGLGLMLLALHQLVITVQPIQTAPVLGTLRDQGIAILLSEQNARMSLRVADRGVVVENGRVALSGSAAELLASSAIAARYLGVEGGSVGRVDERLGARLAAEIRAAQPAGGRERHDTQAGNPHPLHASPAPVPSP